MPIQSQKKKRKSQNRAPEYEGLTKEQIKKLKKEKKQRKLWIKYKEKLITERNETTAKFHSSYYWNSFVISNANASKQLTSGANTKTNNMAQDANLAVPKTSPNLGSSDGNQVMTADSKDKNYIHLQQVITDSCTYYEHMEKK